MTGARAVRSRAPSLLRIFREGFTRVSSSLRAPARSVSLSLTPPANKFISTAASPLLPTMAGPSFAVLLCLTAAAVVRLVAGHSCLPLAACRPEMCEPPHDCPGGVVKETCGCCDVCARGLRQTCGGLHGLAGQCDEGLTCVVEGHGHPHKGNEEGVCLSLSPEVKCESPKNYTSCTLVDKHCLCREINSCVQPFVQYQSREECYLAVAALISKESQANCSSNVHCDLILPSCPADSVPRAGQVLPGECCPKQGTCTCDKLACEIPTCETNYELIQKQKGTDEPGRCCDVYECDYGVMDCSTVKCPPHEDTCPSDSVPLPSVRHTDECCSRPQGCTCLPTSCPVAECADGQRLKIIHEGDGTPGRCCTVFHCIKPDEQTCQYGSEEYVEGSFWKADNCTSCSCKGNVTFCTSEQCSYPSYCGRMQVPEGKCCPICTGCVSSSGAIFDNGDTWQKDDCTTCQCTDGIEQCQAEVCTVQCHSPKRIPGQCCPHCDGPSIITAAPHECPTLRNCTQLCPNGYQKDGNGCKTCECLLDGCSLNCDLGYATDELGNPVCKCRCPSLDDCDKRCIHGFKSDGHGCKLCRCAKCRSLSCAKKCPYGYVRNDRGCRTCRCLSGIDKEIETTDAEFYNVTTEATETTQSTTATLVPFISTCITTGGYRDEGEMWHDGCRNCYCHAGKEMCGLITCPVPACEQPTIFPGDCCPKCISDVADLPSVNVTVCQSVDQTYRIEGETWDLDTCTHCICHNGLVLCSMDICPPTVCSSPVYEEGRCCASCPAIQVKETKSKSKCVSEAQAAEYEDGATWRVGACHSCECLNGQVSCFTDKCPKLRCSMPVLLKGQCCPICLSVEKPRTVCIYDDIPYVSGEMWSVNECTQCMCISGRIECKESICAKACPNPLPKLPGQCCPECPTYPPNFGKNNRTDIKDINNESDEKGNQQFIIIITVAVVSTICLATVGLVLFVTFRRRRHGVTNSTNNQTTETRYCYLDEKDNRNNMELNNKNRPEDPFLNNNKANAAT